MYFFTPQVFGMRDLLGNESESEHDIDKLLSGKLNKKLVECAAEGGHQFVSVMFRSTAFLITSQAGKGIFIWLYRNLNSLKIAERLQRNDSHRARTRAPGLD